jgi:AcrR family transcriptional regulator
LTENAQSNDKSNQSKPSHLTQRRTQIFEKAAYQFCVKGYDSTSMSDIADAVGITKAGLYYFVESKEHLLYLITDYGLDILDEMVMEPLRSVETSVDLLRQLISRHIHLVIHRPREMTMILHERSALTGLYREKILERKKAYINYVRDIMVRLQRDGLARDDVDPTAATFFLLGAMNWIYQWYKVDGRLSEQALADEMTSLFVRSFLKDEEGGG